MRRITALWESFYSKNLYCDAFYSWKGIGFLTLLLLAVIHTLVLGAKIHLGLYAFLEQSAPPIVKQIPTLTFKDGKATTPEPIAYEIKAPDDGQLIAIIDTRVPHPPADLGGALVFVAGESMTGKKSDVEQRSFDYSTMEDTVIDQPKINSWLDVIASWSAVVAAPFVLTYFVCWFLLQLLVFSLATLIFCSVKGLVGSYAATLRLTAIAMVPALVLAIIFSAFDVEFPGRILLSYAIVLGFIFFGVTAARTAAEDTSETHPVVPQ